MTGCDEWEMSVGKHGYGQIWIAGRCFLAHRVVWMQEHGHTDLHILHACDNPRCIRLDHLRAGTPSENMRDAVARGRHGMARKTECHRGHPFTPENTRINPDGARVCRICSRERDRSYRAAALADH
jgi:hypothetical protein